MVVNPVTGKLYVSNTEAQQRGALRGSGHRTRGFKPAGRAGDACRATSPSTAITVLAGANVKPRHLNKHIDYARAAPAPAGTAKQHSLATPLDMAVDARTARRSTSRPSAPPKVGVFDDRDARERHASTRRRRARSYIPVSGGGPGGLALDEARNRALRADALRQLGVGGRSRDRRRDGARRAPQPRAARRSSQGRPVPLRRDRDLEQRRGLVLELPHLRRPRRARLGPRQPGRRRRRRAPDDASSLDASAAGVRRSTAPATSAEFQPDEGPDDHADAARAREQRPDALARRSRERLLRPRARTGRGPRRSTTSSSRSRAWSAALGTDRSRTRRHADVHGLRARRCTLPPNPVRALDNSLTPAQTNGTSFCLGATSLRAGRTASRRRRAHGQRPLADGVPPQPRLQLQRLPRARRRRRASSAPTATRASRTRRRS